MDDRDLKNLNKILEHAICICDELKIIKDLEDFNNNSTISKAVLFDLLQIGELSRNLSLELIKETNIPWHDIYNLRNRIVHGYADVDYIIIWDTVKNDIPNLISDIRK